MDFYLSPREWKVFNIAHPIELETRDYDHVNFKQYLPKPTDGVATVSKGWGTFRKGSNIGFGPFSLEVVTLSNVVQVFVTMKGSVFNGELYSQCANETCIKVFGVEVDQEVFLNGNLGDLIFPNNRGEENIENA
ncbi:hypothetical protein [Brazilian marseillevirus]|uniref:hypothetical protein n=1 Tax=Brazilian marseillevirus TaxID=1813599 RepID=UPI000781526C|nr:hypothetical protein A3303_gp210 [Brazilian marseillevirus]AMQ10718.1 hypothetical protein [Brazilian marseillevirus]